MLARERVIAAIDHQEPDRVPLALGGGPYGIVDDLYLKLVERLKLGQPVQPFRSGHNITHMDDRLLERLGTDIRYCWPGMLPNSPVRAGEDQETFYDSYGQPWKRALPYYYAGEALLKDVSSQEEVDRLVAWPDLSDSHWMHGVRERARELRESTPYFVTMRMVASHGPFQTACDLRGTENFLMDMALNPELAHYLLDRISAVLESLLGLAMQAGGVYFDMVELPGDDYAGNTNLILSPKMFRTFIRPCLERMVRVVKQANPRTRVMFHSDGAITALLPDLIAAGIDVVHPLEPLPATDIPAVKAQFGDQVTFLGGIDISRSMPGTQEEVISEVERRISQLAAGGGYILAPSNHLQADVPPENVLTLFETARRLGNYPVSV